MIKKSIQILSILPLLIQLSGCLNNNGTTASISSSARISYDGSTEPATLTQNNSASLLAGAYEGGQAGNAFGSAAALTNQSSPAPHPRTLLLSQTLDDAVQAAIQHGTFTSGNAAAVVDISNQLTGSCGGKMDYSGNLNEETREFYITLSFDKYCDGSTTINGSATASGQTDTNAFDLDMFNDTGLAPNPYSISFDGLTVSYANSSFSASGYALITKTDEFDQDENDIDPSTEPVNPNNTPDSDDSVASDENPDVGGTTTIKLNCVLRDDAAKVAYKIENFKIDLTNGSGFVDADISGRYYDPNNGYIDVSTPTLLRINGTDYWPSSGVFHAIGNNDAATFTALSNTSYQLDIDTDNNGTADITTTGSWSGL